MILTFLLFNTSCSVSCQVHYGFLRCYRLLLNRNLDIFPAVWTHSFDSNLSQLFVHKHNERLDQFTILTVQNFCVYWPCP